MSVKINESSRKVMVKIKGLNKALPKHIRNGLYNSGKKLRSTASNNILKKPRFGNRYVSRDKIGRRRAHIASKPGESWANQTGEARSGLVYSVSGSDKLIFGNTAEHANEHAKYLELGTKRMKPRPAHLISIKQNKKNIVKYIQREVDKAFKV